MAFLSVQLHADGPIMNFLVGVSEPRRQALLAAGLPVPNPARIGALIDTGASCSVVDRQILRQLGLTPSGITSFRSTEHGQIVEMSNQYDVSLALATQPQPLLTTALPVLEGTFRLPTYHMLIGRDVLGLVRFTYDGPGRSISFQS